MKSLLDYSDPMETVRVFVYGTLKSRVHKMAKRDNKYHHHFLEFIDTKQEAYLLEDAYFFEVVTKDGTSMFPGILFGEHPKLNDMRKGRIYGEVYTLPVYMLTILANIEGSYFDCIQVEANLHEKGHVIDVLVYEASKVVLMSMLRPDEIREIHCGCY